ncbi:MAG: NAD-dependent epimerase/dehydratase family protein, partial [Ruthenibacterium lactatiformans]
SSIQAELDNDYGKSKREAEELIFAHERATGAPALVYRLPGVFGKWCRPSYNSVVATFCHNIANGLPIDVRDPAYSFPLVYIDDVVASFIAAMEGRAARDCSIPGYCHLMCEVYETLGPGGAIAASGQRGAGRTGHGRRLTEIVCDIPFLSSQTAFLSAGHACDARGSFTEFLRTPSADRCPSTFPGPAS